eukprot:jgi/Botrbrau1/7470/Bobra.0095s0008.1
MCHVCRPRSERLGHHSIERAFQPLYGIYGISDAASAVWWHSGKSCWNAGRAREPVPLWTSLCPNDTYKRVRIPIETHDTGLERRGHIHAS